MPRSRRLLPAPLVAAVAVVVTLAGVSWPTLGAVVEAPPWAAEPPPDEVLMVGDSLLHQSRPHFDRRFDELGIEVSWIGGPGEGLLTRQGSWADQVGQAVELLDPDAVVVEACCNYAQHSDDELFLLPDGTPVARDSELMYTLWEQAARDLVARARAEGAEVFVVVAPPPVDGTFFDLIVGSRMERFAATWREVADADAAVHLVDWTDLFVIDGQMATVLPGVGRVRHDDGLHIVEAGHDLIVERTVRALVERRSTTR